MSRPGEAALPAIRHARSRLEAEGPLQCRHRVWLKSAPRLNLRDEVAVFRREMADILAALELGDLEAVGHIRRSHISMSFSRMRGYPEPPAGKGPSA